MSTSAILLKCLPFFGLIGYGLYAVLTAVVPSWREPDWKHWKIFAGEDNSRSLLVQLGFVKLNKPIKEGDFSDKTAIRLFTIVGFLLVLIGIAGIAWFAYLNPGD